jgi:hypothetical protein
MSEIAMLQQLAFGKPQILVWAGNGMLETRHLLRREVHALQQSLEAGI